MSKIYFLCLCGKRIEIDIVGEGNFTCRKCLRTYRRQYESKLDYYEIYLLKENKGGKRFFGKA